MNAERRKGIKRIKESFESFHAAMEELKGEIEILKEEEESYFSNMPENFQQSVKGDMVQEIISDFENIVSDIDDITDTYMPAIIEQFESILAP